MSNAKLDVRRESLTFFTSLLRQLKGNAKDTLLARLDLIRSALYMLNHDSSTIAIVHTLSLLESCFYYEAENLPKKLKRWEKDGEEMGTNPDWALQLNLRWLTQFFSYDGENVLLSLRERFSNNSKIYGCVTDFEFRYFTLEIDQVEAF